MRKSRSTAASRKEGLSYESGVSFDDVSTLLSNSTSENINQPIQNMDNCKISIFDLETTGFCKNDEICQIAACTDDTSFNTYVIPSNRMSKGALVVTGLQLIDGDLYFHENKVTAYPARIAFTQFLEYLKNFQCPIILLAHNGLRFDAPRILRLASEVQLMNAPNHYTMQLMTLKC